jgi:hypothetical protein
MDKAPEAYVFCKNHTVGQAVANSLDLVHIVDPARLLPVPSGLIAAFPRSAGLVLKE